MAGVLSPPTSFADLLRRHRIARALTQEHLAERARITAKAIGALERGERLRPYPHTVQALARALDLGESELVELENAVPFRVAARRAVRPGAAVPRLVGVPAPPVPVLGRDHEVGLVVGLLRARARRVLTLVGPGGVGKTTIALAAAAAVESEFPGGVVMVELAGIARGENVLPTIAAALGDPGAASGVTGAGLAPILSGRRLLLVLDTMEHVLSSGPEIAALVGAGSDLMVLATSRAPLHLRIERQVRVAPLAAEPAIELFRDRVAAAGGSLGGDVRTDEDVAALCSATDGLPLALELAASAVAQLPPVSLVARVDTRHAAGPRDLPARQRSLTASLDWSLALLGAPARALLRRLSVFVGGFSFAAVESVGADLEDAVPSALSELIEHSLVMRLADVEGTERFRLLTPVRRHVAEMASA